MFYKVLHDCTDPNFDASIFFVNEYVLENQILIFAGNEDWINIKNIKYCPWCGKKLIVIYDNNL